MNYKMKEMLKEVCDKKGYKVMNNPLSDNPSSVQIIRINELWTEENHNNGCLNPIQLEINESWNHNEESYVYRDYRYDLNDERLGELSDYVTIEELKDVIKNNGVGDSYKYGKIKEWEVK